MMTEADWRALIDRMPAERVVLGCILIRNEALAEVVSIISSSDFISELNREIYDVMMTLAADRVEIDLITVRDEMEARGHDGQAGYLARLLIGLPRSTEAEFYARQMKEARRLTVH